MLVPPPPLGKRRPQRLHSTAMRQVGKRARAATPGAVVGVISGPSHRPSVEHRARLLLLNPGSAGPRRFTLPVAVARLHVGPAGLRAEIVELGTSRGDEAGSAGRP